MTGSVLVGDVGGTKIRFACATQSPDGIQLRDMHIFEGGDFPSFPDAVAAYLELGGQRPDAALFALAGPLAEDDSIKLTNRPWPNIEPGHLSDRFGFQRAALVNDFAAMARAVPAVPNSSFEPVADGKPVKTAPILVTGPGTGFGISTLTPLANGNWHVITGQGGHTAFSAVSQRDFELKAYLEKKYGYVSTEMVVSGKWLHPVYEAMCEVHGQAVQDLKAHEILKLADDGDPVATETCMLRAEAIMTAAGDIALVNGSLGGVVMTGGVAERIRHWLQKPEAISRFRERGSQTDYMAAIPIQVMTSDAAPLIGAAALNFDMETQA